MKRILSAITAAAAALCTIFCTDIPAAAEQMPDISAASAIVISADTGEVLFERSADKKLPMASTTKIMTTMLAIEHGQLDEQFTVNPQAVKTEGSSMGLRENDKVTLRALCYGMMLPSGNDAANCTAVRISGSIDGFVSLMNRRAKELGLENTHFVTPSGLDDYTDEHYAPAEEMAKLTRYAMRNKTFAEICGTKSIKLCFGDPPYGRWLSNTNRLLKNCHGVIGVKTGFTDKAGRCLVSCCERNGSRLICVTLNDKNDWQDHSALYDRCFSLVSEQELCAGGGRFELNVVGSDKQSVKCSSEPVKVTLLKGSAKRVTSVVKLPGFVYAPTESGTQVGTVEYWYGGEMIAQSPIVTLESAQYCEKQSSGLIGRIRSVLSGLF